MRNPLAYMERRKCKRNDREAQERMQKRLTEQSAILNGDTRHLIVGRDVWIGCAIHTVQPGDTLGSIAAKFGVPLSYVHESNNLLPVILPLTIIEWP